ncbi:putative reverse transcriptase domain-containing protein [Tanacetum coccineum]
MNQPDKLKTTYYFPSIPTFFEPAQLRTDDIQDPLGNDPNDYHLFTPQSHHETEEVSSDEDVDEWLNEELSKRMTGQDKEEEEDALIDLKTVVKECKSIYKKAQIRTPSCRTSEIQGVSFVAEAKEGDSSETLPYQQPSNETNPRSFTLPCTIGNLKIYDMADVGAGINMMPKSLFEHLNLANLKKTSMVIKMGNMTIRAPLGIVENIPVKIDKLLFHFDFVVIDMLEEPDKTILLDRPFLATIRSQIDVFRGEILLGESEYFNPHEMKNDDTPALEQRTFHYSEESVDTVDSSSDSQENEVGSHLSKNVSIWHVCKLIHITFKVCEKDCGIWPTCNPDLSFCSGYDAIYGKEENGMLKQWYGNKKIDDVTRKGRYYEWTARNYDFKSYHPNHQFLIFILGRMGVKGIANMDLLVYSVGLRLESDVLSDGTVDEIMSPRMKTQSVGRPVAESLGGGTGVRVGRGGRGRRPREEGVNGNVEGANEGAPDFSMIIAQQLQNLLPAMLAQVSNRGNVRNQNGNVVNENVQENVRNVLVNGNREGYLYKEFLACNPKEYDGKGGVVVLTRWIEKIEYVHDMSGCSIDQKVKCTTGSFMEFCPSHEMQKLETELWNHAMVEAGHAVYTDRFHELAMELKTIQKAVQIFGALIDEAVRNGSIKKVEKRGNVGEPIKDRNGMDDNKRTRTGNAFSTTVNSVRRENTSTWPKCTTCNSYYAPGGPCRTCCNCNRPGHLAKDCRGVPRNMNPVNARNLTVRACYECGSTNHGGNQGNHARGRAFMLGAQEVRQDPNIMTGTFTLNNHFATTLFDSGADYSFASTTFIPLLGLEPSDLGFIYEIEIASGQLVEIDKVIKGCKLEIEGHVFDIDLIPFRHGRERPKEKARFLMGAKAGDKKQEDIIVVRDFPEVLSDDLSGLPPNREIEFRIKLIPEATPVAKSPYHLAPFELEELSRQLKEL